MIFVPFKCKILFTHILLSHILVSCLHMEAKLLSPDVMKTSNGSIFRVTGLHKGQWRGPFIFSLIYASTNDWVSNRDIGGLRRHCAHYVMKALRRWYSLNFYHKSYGRYIALDKLFEEFAMSTFWLTHQLQLSLWSLIGTCSHPRNKR